jgi:DNA-directed RNA polymerase specialized sigma subunit
MTAKEYLQQYRNADREINSKLDQIRRLRELATKTTSTLNPDKVQSSQENKTEKIVAKIVDMENEVNSEIDKLIELKHEICDSIRKVGNAKQRQVLVLRYINGKTWERIAVDLDISYQWVCELHGRALISINCILLDSN